VSVVCQGHGRVAEDAAGPLPCHPCSYTNCVYLLGNPAVSWSVAASLALSLGVVLLWQRYRNWCLFLAPGLNRCGQGRGGVHEEEGVCMNVVVAVGV
jgi:hypothetical protein